MQIKRLLMPAVLIAAGCATASASIDWTATENLALKKVVTVSSKDDQGARITDGNWGNRWQAVGGLANKNATHYDWVLIDLGESLEMTDIEIKWEASHPTQYNIYVTDDAVPYVTNTYDQGDGKDIDAEWLASHTPAWERTLAADLGTNTESISRDDAVTGRYVLIYQLAGNGNSNNYGCSIFEVGIANLAGMVSEPTTIKWNLTDGDVWGVGTWKATGAKVLDQVGMEMPDEAVTLSITGDCLILEGTNVKAVKRGEGTVTATSGNLSASATIRINYDPDDYAIDPDKTIITYDMMEDLENPGKNAIDGGSNHSSNGNILEWCNHKVGEEEHWLLFDLGQVQDLYAIYATWEGASSCKYDVLGGPTEDNLTVLGTIDTNPAINARKDWFLGDFRSVRYIKIASHYTGTDWGLKLYELKAYRNSNHTAAGVVINSEASVMQLGKTIAMTADVVDTFGGVIKDQEITWTCDNGTVADGRFTPAGEGIAHITATGAGFTAETTVTILDLNADNYLFNNSTFADIKSITSAGITATNKEGDVATIIDGNYEPDNKGNGTFTVAPSSMGQSGFEAEVVIPMAEPAHIYAIALNWEGAYPKDYSVSTSTDGGATWVTVANIVDRQAVAIGGLGVDMFPLNLDNVNAFRITVTKAGTGYGVKLHDFKAYGAYNPVEAAELTIAPSVLANGAYQPTDVVYHAAEATEFTEATEAEVLYLRPVLTTTEGGTMYPRTRYTIEVADATGEALLDTDYAVNTKNATVTFNRRGDFIIRVAYGDDFEAFTQVKTVRNNYTVNASLITISLLDPATGAEVEPEGFLTSTLLDANTTTAVDAYDILIDFGRVMGLDAFEINWDTNKAASTYNVTIGQTLDDLKADPHFVIERDNLFDVSRVDRIVINRNADIATLDTDEESNNAIRYIKLTGITAAEGVSASINAINTFFDPIQEETLTGIDAIATETADAPVVYFNLQGIRIANPTPGSIVIRRQGNSTCKILVK